jgi:MFS family permease
MTRQRTSVLFLNVGHAYDHFFMLIYPTVVLGLGQEFPHSYDTLLSLATGGFIAFGAASLPAGWLGDRWSRTGMITVFFIGIGLSSIVTSLARSPLELALGLGLMGLFAAIYHPVGIALVVQHSAKTGQALGVNGVFGNLGVALAGVTTGALTDTIGWRAAFLLPGCVALATGVVYGLLMRGVSPVSIRVPTTRSTASVTRDIQVRVFMVLIVAALSGGLVFNATTIALPRVLAERLAGFTESTFGIGSLVSLVFGIAAVAQILVGRWLDRYPFKWVLVAVTLVQVPLLLAAAWAHHLTMLLVALPLMFFIFGEIPINDWVVAHYTTERWRSRVYALKYVLSLGVSALAVPLVAWLHGASHGFHTLFLTLAACATTIPLVAASLLPAVRFQPLPRQDRRAQPIDIGSEAHRANVRG